jgi:hypothetical protein
MSAKKRILKVRVSFEPNRLSERYLVDAYERLVPIIHRGIKATPWGKTPPQAILLRERKGARR